MKTITQLEQHAVGFQEKKIRYMSKGLNGISGLSCEVGRISYKNRCTRET